MTSHNYSPMVMSPVPNGAVRNGSQQKPQQTHHQYYYSQQQPSPPTMDNDELQDETLYFERNRIQQLKDERIHIQKKTFTKWCNSYLNKARLEINDLFTDFGDGILLMKFLEIISGEKLGKPNRGRMRVQKIENLNRCLEFLKHKRIQLENIGAEDILDGNERLILGLIWTIILRFTIENIEIEGKESGERKHAKEALLLWCQRKTVGYPNVKIDNFTSSWRNGLAFSALIHAHRPELINFDGLNPQDALGNLNSAFDIAEKKLDIARLLDAEDIMVSHPDEKSIITYVSLYYHYFAKQKTELTGAKRVAKVVGGLVQQDQLQDDYEQLSSDLLIWIQKTIEWLTNRDFPNSLREMQNELLAFNEYRKVDKPPKYKEKGELEALFFAIQTKRTAMRRKPYLPPEGLFIHDIETAWSQLDKAENDRQITLIQELQRQERLEIKAKIFYKKANVRDAWLKEIIAVLKNFEISATISKVEAASKMLRNISTEAGPKTDRFKMLSQMSSELQRDNYHGCEAIRQREREIIDRWNYFLAMLHQREKELAGLKELTTLLRDMDTLSAELNQSLPSVSSRDFGKHMLAVDDYLQKHELVEANINANGEWLQNTKQRSLDYIRNKGEKYSVLQQKLDQIEAQFDQLVLLSRERKAALNKAKEYFQFVQDFEEEMNWLSEKQEFCGLMLKNSDITNVMHVTRQYKVLESEMQAHWQRSKAIIKTGERLLPNPAFKDDIQVKLAALQARFEQLRTISAQLAKWLAEAEQACQYFQDANDTESWIKEKMHLSRSDDYGRDLSAAESLFSRHCRLENEIQAYRADIARLDELANQLAQTQFNDFKSHTGSDTKNGDIDLTQIEEVIVPKVCALYPYTGKGINVDKDEVLALLDKTNSDWWRVLKHDGVEGYVPANYCQVVPGESVTVTQQITPPSKASKSDKAGNAIRQRQEMINEDYKKLTNLTFNRHRLLNDAIKLFKFFNQCDDFESWAKEINGLFNEAVPIDHIQAFQRKFKNLENDLKSTGGAQLKRINENAEELTSEGHTQSDNIHARQRRVNKIWNDLQTLCRQKADELDTAERLSSFNDNCADTRAWMSEKFNLLQKQADQGDIKAINEAEQSQGQQMYDNASRDLLDWINKTKDDIQQEVVTGIVPAEDMVKHHMEIRDEINAKQYEFDYVNELGNRLLSKNAHLPQVAARLQELRLARENLEQTWNDKDRQYRQLLQLQVFGREADRIDALTKGHEAFLDINGLGNSVEGVENLVKQHIDFESKLVAQEDRVKAFNDSADKLIQDAHFHADFIDQRRAEVLQNREKVYATAMERRARLDQALVFENLRRDASELSVWIAEKKRVAADDSYKFDDEAALDRKLLKHEAFVAELNFNSTQLDNINKDGGALVAQNHAETTKIAIILKNLNQDWNHLADLVKKKSQKLGEADDKKTLIKMINAAHARLDEIEKQLMSDEHGGNLRSVKGLIQKKNEIDQDISQLEKKINDISQKGQNMTHDGHYDSEEILKQIDALVDRFNALQDPLDRRRLLLEESLKWHQLAFDADVELQWIQEKFLIADSRDVGHSLTEVTNLLKKHDQLDAELAAHEPRVVTALKKAEELFKNSRISSALIYDTLKSKCDELSNTWNRLKEAVEGRRELLEWALAKEQYLFDLAEIESWIAEKHRQMLSQTENVDEISAPKILAWIKSLMNDMTLYRDQLHKLRSSAEELSTVGDETLLLGRLEKIETDFVFLEELANQKCAEMDNFIHLYMYNNESRELESWINSQLQTAISEDYGHDYEQLIDLKSKFEEFKQNVKTGSERFVLCEETANNLLVRSPPFAREILQKQDKLRSVWTLLLEYIRSKDTKLETAEQLHKFSRDAVEMEDRLQSKRAALSNELGKDPKHACSLLVKHEVFENEIAQLQDQLKELMKRGGELQNVYPGPNADEIGVQLANLAASWEDLKEATLNRHNKLVASYDLQKFLSQARDFIGWTAIVNAEMQSDQKVRDLQMAEWIQQEHLRLRAEIEARLSEYADIKNAGEALLIQNHYASGEVEARLKQVDNTYDAVKREWQLRNEWIEQIVDWHGFEREAKQIIAAIEAREKTLGSCVIGGSVEEVESQCRKFDTFTKALTQLEERVSALNTLAMQLIEQKHMEAPNIDMWNTRVLNQLNHLGALLDNFRRRLEFTLVLARFESEVAEMNSWIDEKTKRFQSQLEYEKRSLSIEEKMEQLQKHQALESELAANSNKIHTIQKQLENLKQKDSPLKTDAQLQPPPETIQRGEVVVQKWTELNAMTKQLDAALKEARDLFDFNQKANRILHWIRDKQPMLVAQELGRDYEHANGIFEKLMGKDSDQSIDSDTVNQVNSLGKKLVASGSDDSYHEVQTKLAEVNEAWTLFVGRMEEYQKMLEDALEVHRFNSDVDDTNGRIQEKAALLSSDDYGKNLVNVEQLLRKQDATERDMSAIHRKLNDHDNDAKKLLAKDPPLRESIIESLQKLEVSWHQLAQLAHNRRLKLQQSYNLHKYFDSVKKLENWANAIRTKMTTYVRPKSVADAQALLKAHDERLAEIDARNEEMKSLREYGQKISTEQPEHKSEIQRVHRRLQNIEHQIRQTWEQEKVALQRLLQLQTLYSQILQIDSWLAAKENFVSQMSTGDSIDATDSIIKKHENFTQTLISQSEKMEQLKTAASILETDSNEPEVERIREQYEQLLQRHALLLENCASKRRYLEEARKLHDFIRQCGEVVMWINEKLQLAYDDGFIDPTNLRSKLQKHLAFDAELQASVDRIQAVREDGEQLIAENNFDKERVDAQLNEVINGWNELKAKSAKKAKLLQEYYEAYQLSRKLDELDKWLDHVEHSLSTNDHGEDIQSVEDLIKKHNELLTSIDAKASVVRETVQKAIELNSKSNENLCVHLAHAESIQQRFEGLKEPCQIRSDNLNESSKFFQWTFEVDAQLTWISDKIPQLESIDYGRSLHSAQSLSKKHQILEQEINTREPIVKELANSGKAMQNHGFVVAEVGNLLEKLQGGFDLVRALSATRAIRLAESLLSQEYYAEATEAEQWMRELLPLVASQDAGFNHGSAEAHLRRLDSLDQEINNFTEQIRKLRDSCDKMISAKHFDSSQLTSRQTKLEDLFETLVRECRRRRSQLIDASRYYSFVRQVDDLIAWLKEKKQTAENEFYGSDMEDCILLTEQFEQIVRELSAAGEKVAGITKMQEDLLRTNHPNAGSIRAKASDLNHLWHEVNDAANDRQQALLDGKNIHSFDQKADDILNRLAEKEAYLVALETEDLTSVDMAMLKAHIQKHDDFLHALYVIEKQVNEICKEADRIIQQFSRTQEHLEVRRMELIEQLKDVQEGGRKISERLAQAQNNQAYFQEYRDLMNWVRHMYVVITGEILPRNTIGCEELSVRHNEYRIEIKSREPQKDNFVKTGRKMIQVGNALSQEISMKIDDLEHGFAQLYDVWHRRQQVYEENHDVQTWLSNAEFLENWLAEREQYLTEDWYTVESVENVEDLIRHFDDFLATLNAQSAHFEALKRLTKLEESYAKMRSKEQAYEAEHAEMATLRRRESVEKKKILQEKRQERERRKTQEISLMKRTPSHEKSDFVAATTLPRARNRSPSITVEQDKVSQIEPASTSRPVSGMLSDASTAEEKVPIRRVPSGKIPGFTTRRPQSIKKMRHWEDLKSIDMHGYIDRKQELQGGGKKATFRSWKNYYTILCGQLLCFFKDEESFMENMAAAPPVYILNATCVLYANYVKKKHTFKLNTSDGAEYLFSADNSMKMIEWIEKINFHAQLAPSNQLASFNRMAGHDGAPSYMPPNPNELSRSHTLEFRPSSSSARNSVYVVDEDPRKSATLDPRRPKSADNDMPFTRVYEKEMTHVRHGEVIRASRLEVTTTAHHQSQHSSSHASAAGSSGAVSPQRQILDGRESSFSSGSAQPHFNSSEDAEFVKWIETSSTAQPHNNSGVTKQNSDDADSIKSKKRTGFSLFKRNSKHTQKEPSK
ncbi:spectrin repeat domain-containing protein [Ditylenchus destructor]|uniref:Spectrin repeat domain-containing protein n=1 Tax=Ditylenchus destructor TaxID=166010 RepID=A0AAD4N820_9BILA|nr:spectrin repeat domain-containing protein [Ditylenchus destructor]